MPSERRCSVPGCKDSGGMHEITHGFPNPQRHKSRFNTWVNIIGGDILQLETEYIHKYRRVCRRHFESKYLCRYGRLSNIAVPTLHLPGCMVKTPKETAPKETAKNGKATSTPDKTVSVSSARQTGKEGEHNIDVTSSTSKHKKSLPEKEIENFGLCAIRHKVLRLYTTQIPTLTSLLPVVQEELGYTGNRKKLRQILSAIGFTYKKPRINKSKNFLMEKTSISAKRERYLRQIISNRNLPKCLQKDIIYLDESYVNSSYMLEKCWDETGLSKAKNECCNRKKYIIMMAGSLNGFVPNTLLICHNLNNKDDYHSEMDQHNFIKWVSEHVVPNLHEPSIIVMDNAPYHTVDTNKTPSTLSKIEDIKLWLIENNINYDQSYSKPELLMLVKKHKTDPIYEVDEMLGAHGHTVVRLPPYHCDLNPAELIWATAKQKMYTLYKESSGIEGVAVKTFSSIKDVDWKKSCEQVIDIENEYYERGQTLYDEITKLTKNFPDTGCSSSSSDNDYSSDVEEVLGF